MFYTEDEKRRRRMAGLSVRDESELLADSMSIRFPMMMTDEAPTPSRASVYLKDTAVKMTFNDALAHIPSEFRHKMQDAIRMMQSPSATAADSGIRSAEDITFKLRMMGDGFYGPQGGSRMTTDADKSAFTSVVDHLQAHIDATRERFPGVL